MRFHTLSLLYTYLAGTVYLAQALEKPFLPLITPPPTLTENHLAPRLDVSPTTKSRQVRSDVHDDRSAKHDSCTSTFWDYIGAHPTPNIWAYPGLGSVAWDLSNSYYPREGTASADDLTYITKVCEFYFETDVFAPTIPASLLPASVSWAHSRYQSAWMSWASAAAPELSSIATYCARELSDTSGAQTPLLHAATDAKACITALNVQQYNTTGFLSDGGLAMRDRGSTAVAFVLAGVVGLWMT
ncbi:hypothetical protein QBC44DRAFT_373005 [Cladorrhinum sp. PSN332]|nr:hypothetical protein QBC44DRAFT_373005 [Cladorrhinum sp. PSN332]